MPRKSEPQPTESEKPYFYPTIGDGVTVFAASQEEADQKAAKLKAELIK